MAYDKDLAESVFATPQRDGLTVCQAMNFRAITQEVCENSTRIPARNRVYCAGCPSTWRRCYVCLAEGNTGETARMEEGNAASGLCARHQALKDAGHAWSIPAPEPMRPSFLHPIKELNGATPQNAVTKRMAEPRTPKAKPELEREPRARMPLAEKSTELINAYPVPASLVRDLAERAQVLRRKNLEVFKLMGRGLDRLAIAAHMDVSDGYVSTTVNTVMHALKVPIPNVIATSRELYGIRWRMVALAAAKYLMDER